MKETKRLHSLDAGRLLDNTMRNGLGRRLSSFKLTLPKLQRFTSLVMAHTLTLEIMVLQFPFLSLWMDKAQFQISLAVYLMFREHLVLVSHGDPACHGLWNSLKNGCKASGHLYLLTESGTMLNFSAGPWGSCDWLAKTWAAAQHLFATLRHGDRLLGRLFQKISLELDLQNTSRGKKKYIEEHASKYRCRTSMSKGEMWRLSEWFGWMKIWRNMICQWHSLLLLFSFIGIYQNYIRRASDIFALVMATALRERMKSLLRSMAALWSS